MKRVIQLFAFILVVSAWNIQPIFANYPIVIKVSKNKKEDRDVKNFNGVAAGGPIQVIITLGSTEGLRFEGDAEAISTLITEVKGNVLIIRPQNSWTSWSHKYQNKKIVAHVSAKSIKSLTMSGDGSISVNGKVTGSSFAATLSGSGSIAAAIDVNDFNGVISGSGNMSFTGTADDANVVISGSGGLSGKKGLTINNLSAKISGSGSVYVTVNGRIDALISGSGSINYSGNAEVNQKVAGSGRVRKV